MTITRLSLRPLLAQKKIIPLLAADTPQTALALNEIEVPAAAIGGFSVAAVQGKPDNATMTRGEYLSLIGPILDSAPQTAFVIDGEDGFGDPAELVRLLSKYSNAAMIFIEDQMPGDKRCGHMDRHQIVPIERMQENIRSAVSAQNDGEPMIMARTDARSAQDSIQAAIDRGQAYAEAGADALFIEAPRSIDELELIGRSFQGVPLLANIIEGGKTPELSATELEELGFAMVVRPVSVSLIYSKLIREAAAEFYSTGALDEFFLRHGKPDLESFRKFIGLGKS